VASAFGAAVGGTVVTCTEAETAPGEGDDLRREPALEALALVVVLIM
jgi:hypothetical protein